MRRLEKIDETVRELWLGILLWGCVCGLVLVWFVERRLRMAFGIFLGCVAACAGVYHMRVSIERALLLGDGARKYMTGRSWMRYGAFLLLFAVIALTDVASPLAAFLGLMGMKVSAYMQPAVHKALVRAGLRKEEPAYPDAASSMEDTEEADAGGVPLTGETAPSDGASPMGEVDAGSAAAVAEGNDAGKGEPVK